MTSHHFRGFNNPRKQRGMSVLGMLIIGAMLAVFGLVGLKVVPAYLDFFAVKKIIQNMATSDVVRTGTVPDIRKAFDKQVAAEYTEAVKSSDLDITKEGGETVVTAAWAQRIPLFANWTLIIDFTTSTSNK